MKKIFFQGDSITDAHRDRHDNHNLSGYSAKAAAILGDKYEYVNYACSGDTSRQVLARHEQEFLKEKADILVYMIGVNDVWRYYGADLSQAVPKEECVSNIKKVIEISKKINPNLKVVFIEPYLIPWKNVALKNAGELFESHLAYIRENIPQLVDYDVPTHEEFLELAKQEIYIADDGVHPNEFGEQKLAAKVVEAIKAID